MTIAVCVTTAVCLLFGLVAPRLGRRLPPATATRLLVPASLVVAACTLFVLGELAFTWLGQVPAIAALGPWSPKRLDALDPVPDPIAAACLVLFVAAVTRACVTLTRRMRALSAVHRISRGPLSDGPVIVVDSPWPDAFTTPAPAARIVVTSGLLKALSPKERQVVLAHEHSHLDHGHVWWILAAELAAGVDPLLRPTATVVGQAVERWADEDAARSVGDRQLVARTIARAALLKHDAPAAATVPAAGTAAATGGDVPERVHALLARPPRRRPLALTALTTLLVASAVATAAVERSGEHLFDRAAQTPPHAQVLIPAATYPHLSQVQLPAAHGSTARGRGAALDEDRRPAADHDRAKATSSSRRPMSAVELNQ